MIDIVRRFMAGLLNDQLISNEESVVFGPTDAAKGTMYIVCFRSTYIFTVMQHLCPNILGLKYSRMAPGLRKLQKFTLRIV